MDDEKRKISATSNGKPPEPGFENASAPGPLTPNGQHTAYWVLSPEERAKGFVRPVRRSYRHVGKAPPKYPLRDLTPEEQKDTAGENYVKYEEYPLEERPCLGRYWTQADLDSKGCKTVTTMGYVIAETYAANPGYYGSTFCCGCGKHLRVGADGEFIWDDGSGERVGT